MIIKGLDNGYLYTKDNDRNIIKSAYSRVDRTLSNKSKIIINGETFYYGKGVPTANVDKSDSLVTRVCSLSILAMTREQTGDDEFCLVVGLPISQYKGMKDKFAEEIMNYNNYEVTYNDFTFRPKIKDVSVFAQGAGVLFNTGVVDDEYIVFDVGSYTINVVLIELINGIPHIIKYDTWFDGILTLYEEIISETNRMFDLTLGVEYAEKIITKGELYVRGDKVDLTYVKLIMKDYLERIFAKFKTNYPYATTNILFCGGGSILLNNILLNEFSNSLVIPDSQFANAIGYYNFGIQKYSKLLV